MGGVIAWNVYRYKVSHLVVEINPLNQAFNITQRHSQRRVKDNMKARDVLTIISERCVAQWKLNIAKSYLKK